MMKWSKMDAEWVYLDEFK